MCELACGCAYFCCFCLKVRAMSAGMENLILVDEETQKKTFKVGSQGGGGTDISGHKWRCGELEWEALMRTLDNAVRSYYSGEFIIIF